MQTEATLRYAGILLSTFLAASTLRAAAPAKNAPPAADPDKDYSQLKMGQNNLPLPADTAMSEQARADLDAAKAALTKAIGGVGGTSAYQVDNALIKTEDYRQAVLDLRHTQADYDAVRRPIFDALRADSDYKELQKQDADNQKVMQALIVMGRGNFDWLFPSAVAALEVRKSMTREEIIALAQAPEVEDARERMLLAAAKVRTMRGDYVTQNTLGPAAKAAQEDVDSTRAKVREAQVAYNAALAKEAEYDRIRQNYLAELRLTGKAPVVSQ